MRVSVTIPQLGLIESVVILEWLISDGGQVEKGSPLLLVETDKAQTEIVAPASGAVGVVVAAGDADVPVGTEVGYIES